MKASNEDSSAEVQGKRDYKFSSILQHDALAERICSDLEQLQYAQILTSLAMGSFANGEEASKLRGNATKRLLARSEVVHLDRKETSRRDRRQVRPSKKIRELQQWNESKSKTQSIKTRTSETNRSKQNCSAGIKETNSHNLAYEPTCNGTESDTRKNYRTHLDNTMEEVEGNGYLYMKKNSWESRETSVEEAGKAITTNISSSSESTEENRPSSDKKSRYRCNQCGKCFKTYYTYSIHIRMPEHTEATPFVCDICNKGFRLSSTLCRHKIIHTSKRPHQCQVCLKNFNRSSTLKMHMRTHSGRKQHVCEECGKGFHQKGNLRNHMFVHSGERPFRCECCGRLFNKKSNLKHHLKIHELNGNLACTVCKTVFEKHEDLRTHMETAHCKQ